MLRRNNTSVPSSAVYQTNENFTKAAQKLLKLAADSKIADLNVHIRIDQKIFWFNTTMYDVLNIS